MSADAADATQRDETVNVVRGQTGRDVRSTHGLDRHQHVTPTEHAAGGAARCVSPHRQPPFCCAAGAHSSKVSTSRFPSRPACTVVGRGHAAAQQFLIRLTAKADRHMAALAVRC
jgi:hypothetical protein